MAGLAAMAAVGCTQAPETTPVAEEGPDVAISVMEMHSRPMRVVNAAPAPPKPTAVPKAEEAEKPRPRRRRRVRSTRPEPPSKPKPAVDALPPDVSYTPPKPDPIDEPPIDIPADSDDVAGELTKEFRRRDRERQRRQGREDE
jgi:hypothetical protein